MGISIGQPEAALEYAGYDTSYQKWATNFYALVAAHGFKKAHYELLMLKGRDKFNQMRWQNLIDKLLAMKESKEPKRGGPSAGRSEEPEKGKKPVSEPGAEFEPVSWDEIPASFDGFHSSVYVHWDAFDPWFESLVRARFEAMLQAHPWLTKMTGLSCFCSDVDINNMAWTPGVFGVADSLHRIIKMPAFWFGRGQDMMALQENARYYYERGYLAAPDAAGFFIHEFGHCLYGWLRREGSGYYPEGTDLQSDIDYEFHELSLKGRISELSIYAMSNSSEFFAEAFTAYVYDLPEVKSRIPEVWEVFDQLARYLA